MKMIKFAMIVIINFIRKGFEMRNKQNTVRVHHVDNENFPVNDGVIVGEQRGQNIVDLVCGCSLLVAKEYMKAKQKANKLLKHKHIIF